ncbi:hypothetical protein CIK79_08115 [Brevibacterium aurantiacum]|uniref:Uncharacterized protein n=1 Tax=Brevibacterium aurantiacum TaxID=273384 RepID=A0A2A3X3G9_BREAU|nr:hypothetical protein CIK79_08115 [Brevibacterium aurantiacum]
MDPPPWDPLSVDAFPSDAFAVVAFAFVPPFVEAFFFEQLERASRRYLLTVSAIVACWYGDSGCGLKRRRFSTVSLKNSPAETSRTESWARSLAANTSTASAKGESASMRRRRAERGGAPGSVDPAD